LCIPRLQLNKLISAQEKSAEKDLSFSIHKSTEKDPSFSISNTQGTASPAKTKVPERITTKTP
jgi:hypothetical protein